MATNPDVQSGKQAAAGGAQTGNTDIASNPLLAMLFGGQKNNAIGGVLYNNQMPDQYTLLYGGVNDNLRYTRYYEGYQYQPLDWSTDQVSNLQAQLKAAGLIEAYQPGVWSPSDVAGYEKALAWANANGITIEQALGGLIASGNIRGGGGGGLGPAPLTDDDVRAIANKTAQGVIGRALREDEMSNFMPAFRGAYASGTSPAVAAEATVRNETAPVEAGGYGMGQVMGAIDQMLKGGGMK